MSKRRYGKHWCRWRKWVIKQAHNQCSVCHCNGYDNYDFPYPAEWRKEWKKLTVHHKQPVSEGGMNNPRNLIALCKSCHSKVHLGTVKL